MPFTTRLNQAQTISRNDAIGLNQEFAALRAELDDIRAKHAAVVALLVAATVLGAGYATGTTLVAKQFTST